MKTFESIVAPLMLTMFASIANSTVIYDESVNGDATSTVSSALIGANVGTLSTGANEILGTGTGTLGAGSDFDDYIFMIAPGSTVSSISFTTSLFLLGGQSLGYGADLYKENTFLSSFAMTNFGPGTFSAFAASMPLDAGPYRIDNRQIPEVDTFNYTWTINADANAVPAPATLALIGMGLADLGWSRHKKA